jgi:hypothetical protein
VVLKSTETSADAVKMHHAADAAHNQQTSKQYEKTLHDPIPLRQFACTYNSQTSRLFVEGGALSQGEKQHVEKRKRILHIRRASKDRDKTISH